MDLISTASSEEFYKIEDIGKQSLPIYYTKFDLLMLGPSIVILLGLKSEKYFEHFEKKS